MQHFTVFPAVFFPIFCAQNSKSQVKRSSLTYKDPIQHTPHLSGTLPTSGCNALSVFTFRPCIHCIHIKHHYVLKQNYPPTCHK